jgi:hypothetical protein
MAGAQHCRIGQQIHAQLQMRAQQVAQRGRQQVGCDALGRRQPHLAAGNGMPARSGAGWRAGLAFGQLAHLARGGQHLFAARGQCDGALVLF